MIASLRGTLIASDVQSVVVECGGVGFRCITSQKTLSSMPKIGGEAFLYTFLAVRDDALDLYGFATEEELEAFRLITSVNGVGAKIGVAILSEFSPRQVYLFIASGDTRSLSKANGVGSKLASRIILELKDKIGAAAAGEEFAGAAVSGEGTSSAEALEALVALGFGRSEASLAVGRFDPTLPTEELIRKALGALSK